MDSTKQRFFSPCPRGLEGVLETELRSLGVETTRKTEGGVGYDASWTSLYRVNLTSRIASRVLWEVGKAHCRTEDDIYRAAYALTWPDWFQRSCTMKVKVSARHSMLKSLDFITLRIKDAVCDKFVRTAGDRPNVDTQKPDVRIDAFLDGPSVVFYLDTSGEPLFKRGYRMDRAEAPLRENLAAGLIGLTGWTPDEAFVDPMCGGGTIPTEAAFIARRIPAGIMRSFAFERLSLHDVKIWNRIRDTAWKDQLDTVPSVIYASDKDPNAVKMAQRTFQGAGVGIDVRLKQADFFSLEPPASRGVMLINPPYGVRLGPDNLDVLYPQIGTRLKQRWAGWRVYVFTADARAPKLIGLAPSKRIPLFNGSLECRLYEFKIVEGSMRRRPRHGPDGKEELRTSGG
ncbi:MAG TPA: class I SAM-dependent RNA methyltransferase [Nitrospira sp.]|nr:class I SAM-dependent RNA methyltransferase [Nitrospira sp.]